MTSPQVIVLCAVVGAGAAVMIGYAIHFYSSRNARSTDRSNMPGDDGFSQAQYMRSVRLRNQEDIALMTKNGRRWREMTAPA